MKRRSEFWSALLGNLFEHYDTALFSCLSPFLAPYFFPHYDPVTALICTYAMIPIGMIVRPIGSIVFGVVGDRVGRKRALFLSLSGMAVVSGGVAFLPTYAQAGFWAPALLGFARCLQNFFAAGEIMGGAIFLLEKAEEKKHDFLSSLYGASTIGGILLASAGIALLGWFGGVEKGWRWLYIFGTVTALFGCLFRARIEDRVTERAKTAWKGVWEHRRALLLIALGAGLGYANYSVALVILNGFVPLISSITKEQMVELNTALLVLDFALLPLFGWIATRVSREKLMRCAAAAALLGGLFLFIPLQGATIGIVIAIRISLVIIGVAFCAPFHAWTQQLVPERDRYLVISLGYACGSQLLGSMTTSLSLWTFQTTGIVSSVGWYWALLGALTLSGLFIANRKQKEVIA
jgi:MFS family permease